MDQPVRRRMEQAFDRVDRWAPTALVLTAMALTVLWIARDHVAPAWDQSHYLWLTDRYVGALETGGVRELDDAVYGLDPARAPLLTVLLVPITLLTGPGLRGALLLNVLLWPVLLFGVQRVATRLFDRRTGLLAMVITATIPLMVGLSHELLPDFLLCALSVLTVAALLETDHFRRAGVSALLGLVAALGLLAKVTFLVFLLGPIAVIATTTVRTAVRELRSADDRSAGLARLRNMATAVAVLAVVAGSWYVPSYDETREYIRSTTSGDLALGAGPEHPLGASEMVQFALRLVNGNLSWVVALVGVTCAAGIAVAWLRGRGDGATRADLTRAAFLVSWVAIPYVAVSTSHNQDPRYVAPAFPAAAILVAGMVGAIRRDQVRRAGAAVLVVGGLLQTSLLTVHWNVPVLPDRIEVHLPAGRAVMPLNGDAQDANRLPGLRDDASPVLDDLEALSRLPDGSLPARRIGVLQPHPAINPNTLKFLAGTRGDPFSFVEVRGSKADLPGLEAELRGFDVILYIPPAPPLARPEDDRLHQLTLLSAAEVITPEMLELFTADQRTYVLLDGRRLLLAARRS